MISVEERRHYYRDRNVRARILEFLGGDAQTAPTCRYLTAGDEEHQFLEQRLSERALDALLENGFEICRSLWDETSLLADFDVEYVNFDRPGEASVNPERTFALQQPVAEAIERTLREYGFTFLHLLSGRGHHFVWRIRRDSEAFKKLVTLGRGPESLWALETSPHRPEGKRVPEELARAFAGLGLVMEFLAGRVKTEAAPRSAIPVELTAVEVGGFERGREMISLDISEYGDPLHTRMTRVPFSVYLKPWQQRWKIDAAILDELPPWFVVPLQGMDWREGVRVMRNRTATRELAGNSDTKIPDASEGTKRLLADYSVSRLAQFHDWFYGEEPHAPGAWNETYDRFPLETLPACVRLVLEQPNDLLLQPARLRQLVRVMLALGWHPRHIAGLIHSKYARPFGWTQFQGYDRATRADFYTRIFAGLFVTGRDDLIDFNCVSAQEQGICPYSNCGFNLLDFRESALNRRANDQLAHRPFNRLLLQPSHS